MDLNRRKSHGLLTPLRPSLSRPNTPRVLPDAWRSFSPHAPHIDPDPSLSSPRLRSVFLRRTASQLLHALGPLAPAPGGLVASGSGTSALNSKHRPPKARWLPARSKVEVARAELARRAPHLLAAPDGGSGRRLRGRAVRIWSRRRLVRECSSGAQACAAPDFGGGLRFQRTDRLWGSPGRLQGLI